MEGDKRFYRTYDVGEGAAYKVAVETTDLFIRSDLALADEAKLAAGNARSELESHIADRPEFATALKPLGEAPEGAPAWIGRMYRAGIAAGTGPMAAVAAAVARQVGEALRERASWVMIENGGDIYLDIAQDTVVGLYAGLSPFSGKLGLNIQAALSPLGVCTSSGKVGPSLSYGKADAATVVSADPALADAVATAMGNRIEKPGDVEKAVTWALGIDGVVGALAVCNDKLATGGALELVKL